MTLILEKKVFFTENTIISQMMFFLVFKYGDMVRDIANRERVQMEIDLEELTDFDEDLADAVRTNVIRYQRLISAALDELIPKYRSVEHPPVKDLVIFCRNFI